LRGTLKNKLIIIIVKISLGVCHMERIRAPIIDNRVITTMRRVVYSEIRDIPQLRRRGARAI
jgi:hypothetical protein